MALPYHVGVIGPGSCTDATYRVAENIGEEIAKEGWILVCGGLGGVMEAAAKGCSRWSGLSVGILPGLRRESANPYIRLPIPTGLGDARNLLVVRASDVLVSISGGYGTLSEIALAMKAGKPVIGLLGTWENISGVSYAKDHNDAIQMVKQLLAKP